MAQLGDLIPEGTKAELAQIENPPIKDSWLGDLIADLSSRNLSKQRFADELTRAMERKQSRVKVNEAKQSKNRRQHEKLLETHKNWRHLIDPDKGEQ